MNRDRAILWLKGHPADWVGAVHGLQIGKNLGPTDGTEAWQNDDHLLASGLQDNPVWGLHHSHEALALADPTTAESYEVEPRVSPTGDLEFQEAAIPIFTLFSNTENKCYED